MGVVGGKEWGGGEGVECATAATSLSGPSLSRY